VCSYSYNLVLFGAGGAAANRGRLCPYKIGNIPDGASNTIAFLEQSTWYPAFAQYETFTSWPYPAYPNTFGPHWPNPDELPGGALYTANYRLPQVGVSPSEADPDRCQSYHPGAMNVALMDGSVRQVNVGLSQQSWNFALDPADGQPFDSTW
jgi:prepilin-type processing-associated H-X9-DG protein